MYKESEPLLCKKRKFQVIKIDSPIFGDDMQPMQPKSSAVWSDIMQKMPPTSLPFKKPVMKQKNKPQQKQAKTNKPEKPRWAKDVPAGEFDEHLHGYWRSTNGTFTYRHPDGRVILGCSGCDDIL